MIGRSKQKQTVLLTRRGLIVGTLSASALVLTATLTATFAAQPSEYKIGALFPLTGPASQTVGDANEALRLAETYFNKKGGIGGAPFKFVWYDTQANTELASRGMAKLADVDGVPVVMSIYTNVAFGAYPIAEDKKVFLNAGSLAPTMVKLGEWAAKPMVLYSHQLDMVLPYAAKEKGVKTMAALYVNQEFGIALKEYAEKIAPKSGIKIVDNLSFENGAPDLKPQLTKVASLKPDALLYEGGAREGALLLRNAKELGFNIPIYSTSDIEAEARRAPELAEGVVWAQPHLAEDTAEYKELQQVIKENTKFEKPTILHAQGWKIVSITLDAIKFLRQKNWDYTGENVRRAFLDHGAFKTVFGTTKFDKNFLVNEPMALYVWKGGNASLIKVAEPER